MKIGGNQPQNIGGEKAKGVHGKTGTFKRFSIKKIGAKAIDFFEGKREIGPKISTKIGQRAAVRLEKEQARALDKRPERFGKLFSGINSDKGHVKFNEVVDKLRKLEGKGLGNFEEGLKAEIKKMDAGDLVSLADSLGSYGLKGFDKKALMEMSIIIKNEITEREIDINNNVIENLNKKIVQLNKGTVTEVFGKMELLGGGAVNKVYKGEFKDENGVQFKGVFKPEAGSLGVGTLVKEQLFGTAKRSGIPVGEKSYFSERSVATCEVDKLIFGDKGVAVKTRFAVINGQRGIVMEFAQGEAPKPKERIVTRELDAQDKNEKKILEYVKKFGTKNLDKDGLKMFAQMIGAEELKIKGGKIECKFRETANLGEGLNNANPKTVKELIDLQILDWVTGQVDRHPENYYIKEDGGIVAIDNDCAFGKDAVIQGVDVRKREGGIVPNDGNLMLRMPPVITIEQHDQIMGMQEKDLRGALGPLLDEKEVDKAVERMKMLKAHVQDREKCTVVGDENDLVTNMVDMNSNNSYFMREIRVYDQDASNWNHLRKYRGN